MTRRAKRGRRSPTHEDGYSGPRAAKLASISYRQLDLWTHRALVKPSIQRSRGSGIYRLYSPRDVLALKVVGRLRKQGVSLKTIATAVRALQTRHPPAGSPLTEYTWLTDRHGGLYLPTPDDATAIDVSNGGQLVFSIILAGELVGPESRRSAMGGSALLQRTVRV